MLEPEDVDSLLHIRKYSIPIGRVVGLLVLGSRLHPTRIVHLLHAYASDRTWLYLDRGTTPCHSSLGHSIHQRSSGVVLGRSLQRSRLSYCVQQCHRWMRMACCWTSACFFIRTTLRLSVHCSDRSLSSHGSLICMGDLQCSRDYHDGLCYGHQ